MAPIPAACQMSLQCGEPKKKRAVTTLFRSNTYGHHMNKPEQITLACRMAPGVDCLCEYIFPKFSARRNWCVTEWTDCFYAFIGGVCSCSRQGNFQVGCPKPGFGPDMRYAQSPGRRVVLGAAGPVTSSHPRISSTTVLSFLLKSSFRTMELLAPKHLCTLTASEVGGTLSR